MSLRIYLYEKPVASAPVIPTTATLGTLTAIGSTLGGNQYQCNIRVDATNAQRQAVTFKTGTAETDVAIIWTTDGWSTQSNLTVSSAGDPDCVWDGSGNLYFLYMDKAASNLTKVRKLASPYTTFGSAVSLGVSLDHPHIAIDRSGGARNGTIYVWGCTFGTGKTFYIASSTNGGSSFTANGVYTDNGGAGPFMYIGISYGGCVTSSGSLVMHGYPRNTQFGSPVNYSFRSTDGGASVGTPVYILLREYTTGNGYYDNGDVAQDTAGRLYMPLHKMASSVLSPAFSYSDDDGVTWSAPAVAVAPPSGYEVTACSVFAGTNVVGLLYYVRNGTPQYQVWFTWSNDQGSTWQTPVQLSTQSTPSGSPQPRTPGNDQTYACMVGNTAYVVWSEGSTASTYTTNYRTITFS